MCVCVCVLFPSFPQMSTKCIPGPPQLASYLPFYEVPYGLSLKIISGLDKMWNEAERPKSSQKWSQMDIILWQTGRRVFTSLPCLWWENWKSILSSRRVFTSLPCLWWENWKSILLIESHLLLLSRFSRVRLCATP